jgi:hypothetical protein
LLVQCVVVVVWFVVGGSFFFSFFFSLIPEKLHLNRLCCWYFNFNSYSFDFYINIKSMPTRSHLVSAWIDSCPKVGLFFIPILSNWKRLTFLFLVFLYKFYLFSILSFNLKYHILFFFNFFLILLIFF